MTYRIAGGVLLLCRDDRTASLGGIEAALSTDDRLAHAAGAARLATDLGNGIPVVRHLESFVVGLVGRCGCVMDERNVGCCFERCASIRFQKDRRVSEDNMKESEY